MTDQAAKLAEYLIANRGMSFEEKQRALVSQWSHLSQDEFKRGIAIAQECLEAEAAEHFAEADALDAEARRREGLSS
jgi:hypothetical protein